MLQRLRLTVAVSCLLATACFVIFWMRSLKQWDNILYAGTSIGMLDAGSSDGMLSLYHAHAEEYQSAEGSDRIGLYFMTTNRSQLNPARVSLWRWPRLHRDLESYGVFIPFWLLILVSGCIGAALSVRRPFRFQLRTLAIGATLIVITFGLGVAASRLNLDESPPAPPRSSWFSATGGRHGLGGTPSWPFVWERTSPERRFACSRLGGESMPLGARMAM